jgi:hypothetical protein
MEVLHAVKTYISCQMRFQKPRVCEIITRNQRKRPREAEDVVNCMRTSIFMVLRHNPVRHSAYCVTFVWSSDLRDT